MLLINHPDTYPAERAYVLDVVLGELLGLPFSARAQDREDVEITAPELAGGDRLILADRLFATSERDWLTDRSLPERPLARWQLDGGPLQPKLVDNTLPVLYAGRPANDCFCEEIQGSIVLGVDVFGSIFFQLSRYEEIVLATRDEHDRFPASASLALAEGFLERPLANEYVELLWTALSRLWPRLRRRRGSFTERVSHDVDWPVHPPTSSPRAVRTAIGHLLRGADRGLAGASLRAARARRRGNPADDPYNTFDLIMDLSEERGLRSAFYFMAGRTDPRFDGSCSLTDPWIQALIGRIHERGHELGLHPSYGTFRDPDAIARELETLLQTCARVGVEQAEWGGRQHFLRWENPVTWRGWEQAGLAYDSSLGYSHDPGFRCGACCEYPAFDLLERKRLRLRERPLIVMEMAAIDHRITADRGSFAGDRDDDIALALIERLRQRTRMFDGDFTLLWHNSRLTSRRERRLYQAALAPNSVGTQTPPEWAPGAGDRTF